MNTEESLETYPQKIPKELKSFENWIGWKPKTRDGNTTKVPYDPTTGRKVSSTDSETWTTFQSVIDKPKYGLGFVLTNSPFVGVDLDHCRNTKTGELENWAEEIIEKLDSYTEISPSGTGLHIILKGELPGSRNRDGDLEMYDTERYFTVTGNHLEGTPEKIRESSEELEQLYSKVFGEVTNKEPLLKNNEKGTGLSDKVILEKAREAKNGDKFKSLWNGNISDYPSHSEADQALVSILAFYTGPNPRQIDRLFRRSGLMREKWKNREDYRKRTIKKVLNGKEYFYHHPRKLKKPHTNQMDTEGESKKWKSVDKAYKKGDKQKARNLASQLLLKERDFVVLPEGDQFLVYKEEEGIYDGYGREYIKMRLELELASELSRHEVKEITSHVERGNLMREEDFGPDDQNLICLKNGVFNLSTQKLLDHDPKYQFRRQIPVKYEPNANSEILDDFLHSTIEDEDIPLIEEIAGYCLYRDYFIQKAFMFIGGGSNGKGVTLDLIVNMLGEKNVSGKSLQRLTGNNNRFAVQSLYKKYANIAGDLPGDKLGGTGIFKELTGQDFFEAEVKNSNRPIRFKNHAKMLFSANRVPQSPDDTDAFHRRWVLLTFPFKFVNDPGDNRKEKQRDPHLREKLNTEKVKSALFNRAVKGLQRLLDHGKFSYDPTASEARKLWQRQARPIKAFAQDKLETGQDKQEFKSKVYKAYKDYCEENDIPEHEIKKQAQFSKELKKYVDWEDKRPKDQETGNRRTAYKGFELIEIPF